MNVAEVRMKCKAIVHNVPEDVAAGKRGGYMVVSTNGTDLWYYGVYESDIRAQTAALEADNRIVLEVGDGQKEYR